MTDDFSRQLNNAREAISRGDKRTAQQILADILSHDNQNVDAWLLLADILDNPQHRIESLKRVLQINPNNVIANRRLQEISIPERLESPGTQISQPRSPTYPSEQIPQPKVPLSPRRQDKLSAWVYVLIVVACCLIVGIVFFVFSANQGGSSNKAITDTEALTMCQQFVTNHLIAPSTAKFPGYYDTRIGMLNGDPHSWRVIGYVDAQNAFGAQIRNYYTCDARYNGGEWADINNWTLLNLVMQ